MRLPLETLSLPLLGGVSASAGRVRLQLAPRSLCDVGDAELGASVASGPIRRGDRREPLPRDVGRPTRPVASLNI